MGMNLASVELTSIWRGLLVGQNGRGKTIAGGSFPGETMIFDFDHRFRPIVQFYPNRLKDFNVEIITPQNYVSVFETQVNKLLNYNPYANIMIDGITGLSNTTIVMQMLAGGKAAASDKNIKMKTTKGGVMVPSWDEFNGEAMLITQLLECLKSIQCNLIVTAHPIARTDMKEGKYTSLVAFGNKVASLIPGYFDEIYYLDYEYDLNGSTDRMIYTRPTSNYPDAKTALGSIPGKIKITDKPMYDCIKEYL